MKPSASILITLVILFSISVGCKKKCNEKELATFSFSVQDKKLIPYKGDEILTLNFNDGNYDSLKGIGRNDHYYEVYENSSSDNNDCKNYYTLEYNRFNFPTILVNQSSWLISLSQEFTNPLYTYNQKFLSISIGATYAEGCFYMGNFLFNNDTIVINKVNVFYHAIITIGSKVYLSVYELKSDFHTETSFFITTVYYTTNEGIIALKNNTETFIYVNKTD
jgi:hypothetical protein